MTKSRFMFNDIVGALQNAKRNIPVLIAGIARNYFVKSFTNQGFDGKQWKQVQRRIPGTKEYKYPKETQLSRRTNPILIGTGPGKSGGTLRREVNNSIRTANWNEIKLGVSDAAHYAQYHNEGTAKIPQRKFMGNSRELDRQIKDKLRTEIGRIFR